MMKDTIEIDDFGKKIEFKARRIQLPSNEEKLRLYVIKDGEEILVLEEFPWKIDDRRNRAKNSNLHLVTVHTSPAGRGLNQEQVSKQTE